MMNNNWTFRTLVIIDLETTGLIYDEPKIIELAMTAVNISTLEEMNNQQDLPRIMNKFVKFFDPNKDMRNEVVELTGLNNSMLSTYKSFNRETVRAMEAFLNEFPKPLCFAAHNGNLFDFPILFQEIQTALSIPVCSLSNLDQCHNEILVNTPSLPTNDACVQTIDDSSSQSSLFSLACADSLVFFREMYRLLNDKDLLQSPCDNIQSEPVTPNEKPPLTSSSSRHGYVEIPIKYIPSSDPARQQPSMKLVKIYEREFPLNSACLRAHRAEDDCLMLLALLKRYLPDWLEWIETNHRLLKEFPSTPVTTMKKSSSPPKPLINRKPPLRF